MRMPYLVFRFPKNRTLFLVLSKSGPPTCVLGLHVERCMSWVKRWNAAMDFFQTLGKIGGSHDELSSYNMLQPILGLEKGKKNG